MPSFSNNINYMYEPRKLDFFGNIMLINGLEGDLSFHPSECILTHRPFGLQVIFYIKSCLRPLNLL
jgi:hypothetical protein